MTEWIVIPNWEKFNHRADRSLPWLKLYIELSGRDDWRHITLAERGLLVCIWIEYRRSKGVLRTSDVPGLVAQKVPRRSFESLQAAGFIALLDTQPAQLADTPDKRREEETPKPPSKNHRKPKTTGWRLVRGTHGQTHIPDPQGTDRPPPEVRT